MLALAGNNDFRDIEAAAEKNNLQALVSPSDGTQVAIKKYIGKFNRTK